MNEYKKHSHGNSSVKGWSKTKIKLNGNTLFNNDRIMDIAIQESDYGHTRCPKKMETAVYGSKTVNI